MAEVVWRIAPVLSPKHPWIVRSSYRDSMNQAYARAVSTLRGQSGIPRR